MPSSSAASADAADGLKCSVCGETADGQHFGAYACRACCAFYRRTIARNLKYVCRFNNQCEISQSYRCLCRACRLKKCTAVGMKKEAVQRSRVPVDSTGTSSKRKPTAQSQPNPKPQEHAVNLQSPQSNTSSSSSTCPLKRPLPESSPTTSIAQRLKSLQAIMNKSKKTIIIDESSLPPTHPTLSKMLLGYEELQRLRDLQFARSSDIAGVSTRTFIEKDTCLYMFT
ncbi:Nuclear hormone receptor family member nhr-28 [Aphelenchoides besseyi]|nr:Nuclear hormone receptor family member nhr-28 [Aphelenchoides besseyi]